MVPALRPDLTILRLKKPARRGIYLVSRKDRDGLDEVVAALTGSLDKLDRRGARTERQRARVET